LKTEEAKTTTKALNELNESLVDLLKALKGTTQEVEAAKKLWRTGNKSTLIKIGISLIMFPEPTPISETVGACFIAAGAIQKGIQKRAIYLEDVRKTFQITLKEIWATKYNLQI